MTGPPIDFQKHKGTLEQLLSAWIDERLRSALDEKLRGWTPAPPVAAAVPGPESAEYLARRDAAKLTGYSVKTISRWIRSRKLRAFGLRGDRVKRSDVERLMAELPSQAHGGAGIIESEETVTRRILDGERNRRGNR